MVIFIFHASVHTKGTVLYRTVFSCHTCLVMLRVIFPNLENVLKKIHVLYGLKPNRFIVNCNRSEKYLNLSHNTGKCI